MFDRVVECCDHVADVTEAVAVEHFEDDKIRGGGDASPRAVGIVSAAGDDSSDVRAVAVVVVRLRLILDEVGKMHDAIAGEIVVPRGDAGIDDRDANAGTIDPEVFANPLRANRRARAFHRSLNRAVEADGSNAWPTGQRFERAVGDDGHLTAHQAEATARSPLQRADQAIRAGTVSRLDDHPRGSPATPGTCAKRRVQLGLP